MCDPQVQAGSASRPIRPFVDANVPWAEEGRDLATRILQRLNEPGQFRQVQQDILALIHERTGIEAAAIRLRDGEDFPYDCTLGFPEAFIECERSVCAREPGGAIRRDAQGEAVIECLCGNVLRGRGEADRRLFTDAGTFWANSTSALLADPEMVRRLGSLRGGCPRFGYESIALIPLRAQDEIVGLLQLNDRRRDCFTPELIRYFEQVGASIGIALGRKQANQRIRALAKFPDENPNPVLRLAADGTILYANAAGEPLLALWGRRRGERIEEPWRRRVADALAADGPREHEVACDGRIFSLAFSPVRDGEYVNLYGHDITERKLARLGLERELAVSQAVADLSAALIAPSLSIEELSPLVLGYAKLLTGSPHGYVGYIDPDNGDLVCPSLSDMMGKDCRLPAADQKIRFPLRPDGTYTGLWGHALNTRRAFFTNHPPAHPAFGRLPEGHVPMANFLSVPAIVGDQLVGQIALANADHDYGERDLSAIRRLTDLYAAALHRCRAEQALRDARDRLEVRVEQRTAELAQTNELLEQMFAGIHLAIAYMDRDFNFLRVNRRYAEADGRSPDFFPGKNHFQLYPNAENEAIFRQVVETGRPHLVFAKPFVYAEHPERGTTYWDWSLLPVHDAAGAVRGVVLSLLDVTDRKRLEREVLAASEAERQRIGEDLHDSLCQTLSGVACLAQVLHRKLADRKLGEAADAAQIRSLLSESVQLTRSLSHGLNPVGAKPDSLMIALREMAATVEAMFQVDCLFRCPRPVAIADPIATMHLYRIAQEAAHNAVRHGKAKQVTIRLVRESGAVTLAIRDDGVGMPPNVEDAGGMGLRIMKHRADAIGASLEFAAAADGGAQVVCRLPLPAEETAP